MLVMTSHVITELVKHLVMSHGKYLGTASVIRLEQASDEWSERIDAHDHQNGSNEPFSSAHDVLIGPTTLLSDAPPSASDVDRGATGAFTGAAWFGDVVHFLPPIFYLMAFLLPTAFMRPTGAVPLHQHGGKRWGVKDAPVNN
jgi:hypothetical protein